MSSAWLLTLVSLGSVTGFSFTTPTGPTLFAPGAPAPAPVPDSAGTPGAEVPPPALPTSCAENTFWFGAEYLLWKVQGQNVPVLVGTVSTTDAEVVRQLPANAITPLFGGNIPYDVQSGFRVTGGAWLDDDRCFGLEAGFFLLGQAQQHYAFASNGGAALGPVFHDPAALQDVLIMEAVPGLRAGTVAVDASNRLWGTEANVRLRLATPPATQYLHLLAGFRYLQFNEGLAISGTSRAIPGGRMPCG